MLPQLAPVLGPRRLQSQLPACSPEERVLIALPLPDLTEQGKAEEIEEGKYDVAVDIIDALTLTNPLYESKNCDEDQKFCVRRSKTFPGQTYQLLYASAV